jgi:hypothetical protein
MEILKKFTFNSSASSLTGRKTLFDELFAALDNETTRNGKQKNAQRPSLKCCQLFIESCFYLIIILEIPEAGLKLLAKMNYYLFPIYIDKASKLNMAKLNDYLIRLNVDQSLKIILASFEAHSRLCASNVPK